MKIIIHFTICLFLVSAVACDPNSGTSDSQLSVPFEKLVSNSYKPHDFLKDQRIEKIKGIEEQVLQLMEAHAKDLHLPGVAFGMVVDNQMVISGSIGVLDIESKIPVSVNSAFRIASMSKSFTAMAIIKLRDEGKLSLSDPAEKYIPEMKGLEYLTSDSPTITIENLLTMTAGFPEDNPWGDRQLDEPDEMLLNLMSEGVSFSNPASFTYEYSNTGYALLGNIISKVSGMPYQQYINNNILKPLEMNHTYWEYDSVPGDQLAIGYRWEDEQWKLEPMLHDGSYGAMGGLITSIEDFSKYVSYHLSAWPPRSDVDEGPVKRSSLREMHTPKFSRLYSKSRDFNGEPCPAISGYGYGLSISNDCMGLKQVRHGGALPGFGSSYVFFPDYGVGIMAFCNLTYTSAMPTEKIKKLLFDELKLEPRKLPVSDMLTTKKNQVIELINTWSPELEKEILAENFYLDRSKEMRKSEIDEAFRKVGDIKEVGDLNPVNQLRAWFEMTGEKNTLNVYFTLSPEKNPKVQYLEVWIKDE